jgi:hypothetical protein
MNGVVDIQKVRVPHCYKVTSNSPEVGWLLQRLTVLWGRESLTLRLKAQVAGFWWWFQSRVRVFMSRRLGTMDASKHFRKFMRALPLFPHLNQPIWQHSGSSSSVRSGCSKFLASFQCEWTKEHSCYYIHPPSDFGSQNNYSSQTPVCTNHWRGKIYKAATKVRCRIRMRRHVILLGQLSIFSIVKPSESTHPKSTHPHSLSH